MKINKSMPDLAPIAANSVGETVKKAKYENIRSTALSKFLAQAGIASRRKVVDIIKSNVVTVNGVAIIEPGFKVNNGDCVRLNDTIVRSDEKVYILLNKPKNCITTVSDDLGRHHVLNLIAEATNVRVYPVGRLDRNTTGLLLLTNDGELALKLSHPRFEVEKIYHVQLDKSLTRAHMHKVMSGLQLEDGFIAVDAIQYFPDRTKQNVMVAIHSGKNRIVRRIFENLGYDVRKLDRAGYAGLTKSKLEVGQWRYLTKSEVAFLKQS